MACLVNYDWPGNVRELENAIERSLVLSVAESIRPEDLPESILEKDLPPGAVLAKYHTALKETKKQLILRAVQEPKGTTPKLPTFWESIPIICIGSSGISS